MSKIKVLFPYDSAKQQTIISSNFIHLLGKEKKIKIWNNFEGFKTSITN